MPDFSALLSKPADEIKKPKPLPIGSYSGLIQKFAYEEAKTPRDKENPTKPVVNLTIGLDQAMEDVDSEALAEWIADGAQINGRTYDYTFWLTADAQYRVVEFAQSLGIDTSGKTLGEIISEFPNNPVIASVEHVQSKKAGQEDTYFANITNLVGTAAA